MARRIRWQILVTLVSGGLILLLLGHLALSTAAQGDPSAGGSYSEALVGEIRDLNPLRGTAMTRPEADISALLFEGLTRVETSGIVALDLAEGLRTDSSERIYTVTLRPDVTWHDGAPFSANDVMWTLNWIKSPTFTGDPALQTLWDTIFIRQIDGLTIQFTLPAPFAPFASQLTLPILPSHLLQNADSAALAAFGRAPVGTGIYKLRSLDDRQAELEIHRDYRAPSAQGGAPAGLLPNLETLTFRLYPSLDEAHLALRRGEVKALAYDLTGREPLTLPTDHRRVRAPLADYTVLTFNLRRTPFDELALRQALSYAIDPQAVIDEALAGQALPLLTPILPSSWAYARDLTPYRDNPEHIRATQLLDDTGWRRTDSGMRARDGQPLHLPLLTVDTPDRQAVAGAIAAQLRTVGVSVTIEPVSNDELAARLARHDFALALHGWSNLGSDPDVYELWHSSQLGAANFAGLEDPSIDALLVQARQTSSLEARTDLYHEFQRRWLALAPSIVLYQPLLEQQTAPQIQILGMAEQAGESEVLYTRADRFRRLANWYEATTIQILPNLRRNPGGQRPR